MELLIVFFVCFIAGMGAGLGTGFAGMSAAAVISPMLITFLGMPAYQAVGIALASDFDTLWGRGKGDPADFASVAASRRPGEHWIAVAPFARHRGKIYPIAGLERVIEHFDRKPDHRIFIFGFGDEEKATIASMAKRFPSVVNMAEAGLGIAAELSLLSHCDVMLSMDSANMHLASLVGLRTVSVWGATHPYAGFLGWRQRTRDVVQLDMTCRPCSV